MGVENIVWLLSLHDQIFKKSKSWPPGLWIDAQMRSQDQDWQLSDARRPADLSKGVTDNTEIMLQLIHDAG